MTMEALERHKHSMLSLFRIVVGLLFACHGAASLFGVFGTAHSAHFGSWPTWWSGLIELAGGLLVLLGVGTRIAAVICSGAMAYAYFTVHQKIALWPIENNGELAAVYAWVFLLIAFFGPGSLTLGALIRKARRTTPEPARTTSAAASAR
jgi:putative oxidoreductase